MLRSPPRQAKNTCARTRWPVIRHGSVLMSGPTYQDWHEMPVSASKGPDPRSLIRGGTQMDRRTFLTITLAAPALMQAPKKPVPKSPPKPAAPALAQPPAWTQWGGPHRNFQTEASGLKDTWPAGGPSVIWQRPLGEGYSSPSVEDGVFYTMYGRPREEVVLAASAADGKTIWEHATPMTFQSAAPEQGN